MSEDKLSRVSVRLLDREYQVACPMDERSDLLDSAEYLDAKMREVRDSGKVVGLDRVAVISALNIANELIKLRRNGGGTLDVDLGARLKGLRERVELALEKGQQLEL
jgi:cell division protein ZapA